MTARAAAAAAVFVAIAVALLAWGSQGPLAHAEADKGDTGTGAATQLSPPADAATPVEEPVLGSEHDPAADDLGTDVPPAEEPAAEAPAPAESEPSEAEPSEPPVDGPPAEDPGGDAPGGDDRSGEDPPGEEPGDEDTGDGAPGDESGDEDSGRRSRIEGGAERQRRGGPSENLESEDLVSPPTGGSKGEDSAEDPEGEPEPAGRDPIADPASVGDAGSAPNTPAAPPSQAAAQVGNGRGRLRDPSAGGSGGHSVSFGAAAASTGETGGTTADDTAATPGPLADTTAALPAEPATGDEAEQSDGGAGGGDTGGERDGGQAGNDEPNFVPDPVERLVEVVPDSFKAALAALAALSVLLGVGYLLAALRARRLARQRRELLQEVGLLQTALLPPVPDKVGSLRTSVAYRPADGPGAGGDFYDVLPLPGGRVGFILGDVSGHGRGALARTAFMRYTLRAYLEAGLEPRVALQVAGRVLDDNLGGDFATVLLAVHDPETGSLTYATAGHPAPIVVGPQPHDPVTAGSSPPIGVGVRTGLRQTTVPLVPGAVACLYTDGLMEARTDGGILGRERLAELLDEIRETASARGLIERVASVANVRSDDMAAVVVSPTGGVTTGLFRSEQLELSARDLEGPIARRFLEACGVSPGEVDDAERDARLLADRFGGVVLHVVFGNRLRVEVLPRNVESIEAASRRVSAESPR
jgi:hypothetical protein